MGIILHPLDIFLQDKMLERKYLAKNIFHRFWCSNSIKKYLPNNSVPRKQ